MTKIKFSATLLLGILFGGTILAYSFIQPFHSNAVCEAIPERASFVFMANSLDELLQSPVCSQLDKALGAGNSLKELMASNDWKKLAAASEIAVADIPFRSAGRQKTWAAVSWVGWRSPWLRWKLEHSRNKNLKLLGKHAVWPVWQYDSPELARGMSLTFALTDNLFLACLSESPTDILLLLDTYDKRAPAHTQGNQP
ncbi:MAG: hypothetical protein U9P12_08990 [Verrucomicrobiota bacterium]|nr:hypothetical protein [Verrucomicrobiota bacterium]